MLSSTPTDVLAPMGWRTDVLAPMGWSGAEVPEEEGQRGRQSGEFVMTRSTQENRQDDDDSDDPMSSLPSRFSSIAITGEEPRRPRDASPRSNVIVETIFTFDLGEVSRLLVGTYERFVARGGEPTAEPRPGEEAVTVQDWNQIQGVFGAGPVAMLGM